jgi:hypothetical protein
LFHKTTPELEGPCSFPDTNLFILISWHWIPINLPMVGAPDSRYPTMSALNTQRSLLDSKLRTGRSKMPLNENLVYEVKLKLQQFTGIKGPIRKI